MKFIKISIPSRFQPEKSLYGEDPYLAIIGRRILGVADQLRSDLNHINDIRSFVIDVIENIC